MASTDTTPVPIAWSPCANEKAIPGAEVECAFVEAPLDYDLPGSERLTLEVRHLKSRAPARAQLWLLAGGPGDAATSHLLELAHGAQNIRDDLELYAVDH